jgi:hypothetical protein
MELGSLIADNIPILLGGGFLTSIAIFLLNRRKAGQIESEERRAQARLPAELNDLVVQGAERTMTIMQSANDRLVAEIARKNTDLDHLRLDYEREIDHIKAENERERTECEERIASIGHQLAMEREALRDVTNRHVRLQRDYDDLGRRFNDTRP